jgi:uncharacterized membrane protein
MLTERKRKIITAVLIAVAVAGMAVGYIVLPNTLVVQRSLDGTAGNTMPKLLGLAIPAALMVIGAIQFYKNGITGGASIVQNFYGPVTKETVKEMKQGVRDAFGEILGRRGVGA